MNLSDYCAAQRGRLSRLARVLGLAPAHLSQIAAGDRPIPVRLAARIERETGGQVTRPEMFPRDWQEIWPELASVAGAPVSAQGAATAAPVGEQHLSPSPLSLAATVPAAGGTPDHPEEGSAAPLAGDLRGTVRRGEDRAVAAGIAPDKAMLVVDRRQRGRLAGGKRGQQGG